MSDIPTTARLRLESHQVAELMPLLKDRTGDVVIVAGVHPDGSGWVVEAHRLPGERGDSIRAACRGDLSLKPPSKPKKKPAPIPFPPPTTPTAAA